MKKIKVVLLQRNIKREERYNMKDLPIYKIEKSTKLDEADKAAIRSEVRARMEEHLEYRSEFLIDAAEYVGDTMSSEAAEGIIKYDILNDFGKINDGYELTSVTQEDNPEQYAIERNFILEWANE